MTVTNKDPLVSDRDDFRPKPRYALRHRTSRRWLGISPSLDQPFLPNASMEVLTEGEAATHATRSAAEWERDALGSFKDAWEVVAVPDPAEPLRGIRKEGRT